MFSEVAAFHLDGGVLNGVLGREVVVGTGEHILVPGLVGEHHVHNALAAAADGSEESGEIALTFGLVFALVSMTTAMAQVERGTNRIYGIRRDRPALWKYGRAAAFTALLAAPVGIGLFTGRVMQWLSRRPRSRRWSRRKPK